MSAVVTMETPFSVTPLDPIFTNILKVLVVDEAPFPNVLMYPVDKSVDFFTLPIT